MKKHIFLIGFMGCGKSTNAAVLAALTDRRQIEMDEEIAAGQGMPVQEIFKDQNASNSFFAIFTQFITFSGLQKNNRSC